MKHCSALRCAAPALKMVHRTAAQRHAHLCTMLHWRTKQFSIVFQCFPSHRTTPHQTDLCRSDLHCVAVHRCAPHPRSPKCTTPHRNVMRQCIPDTVPQCDTVHHTAVRHSALQLTDPDCTTMHHNAPQSSVLCCTALRYTTLHHTTLHHAAAAHEILRRATSNCSPHQCTMLQLIAVVISCAPNESKSCAVNHHDASHRTTPNRSKPIHNDPRHTVSIRFAPHCNAARRSAT